MISEVFLILVIALIVFGPKQLQQLAYKAGQIWRWFQHFQKVGEQNIQELKNQWVYQQNLARAQKVEMQNTDHYE